VDHAHAVGVVRQPRFAARQPPPSCPSTVTTTRKPTVVSPSASPEASSVLGLLPGVEATRALARQPCVGLLLASRFVCAISVSCVGRHTTTTFMPFAARLGIIKVPQGQSAMAVAARSSEQVVLGSAGLRWAAVFSGRLRPLDRYRLLRTPRCVSSVPHGPPRARPPSLSGFDPPRGRPSSVGHSAPLITADLRSELPAACGGLSAVQRPQPHVLVSGRQFAFSLFLTHLPHESRACTARQVPAARAWVANQVKNGRSAPMRSMLPESRRHGQRQWPRWSARMSWEHALAWACRLAAGAIDRRGERQP